MHRKTALSRAVCAVALTVLYLGCGPGAGLAESRDDWQLPGRVIADLGLRPDTRVADIGCGPGYFTIPIAAAVGASGVVMAVDPSQKALDSLRERIRQANAKNIKVIQSTGASTGLGDASCDAVFICNVLHEVSPASVRPALMRDIARAMKPGASLHLLDLRKIQAATRFDPIEKIIAREDLLRMAADAGLELDAEFYYLKYQVFLRFRKPDQG